MYLTLVQQCALLFGLVSSCPPPRGSSAASFVVSRPFRRFTTHTSFAAPSIRESSHARRALVVECCGQHQEGPARASGSRAGLASTERQPRPRRWHLRPGGLSASSPTAPEAVTTPASTRACSTWTGRCFPTSPPRLFSNLLWRTARTAGCPSTTTSSTSLSPADQRGHLRGPVAGAVRSRARGDVGEEGGLRALAASKLEGSGLTGLLAWIGPAGSKVAVTNASKRGAHAQSAGSGGVLRTW